MLLVEFETLLHHKLSSLYILFISVRILPNLIIQIRIDKFFLVNWSTLALDLLIHQFLELYSQFDLFSGLVVGGSLKFALPLQMHLKQLEVSVWVLFEVLVGAWFIHEYFIGEELIGTVVFSQLDAEFC